MLNPVQTRIASGMSTIEAFLTENTCGEACWQAREDVCRCRCHGKNHGCMRSADGVQPQRTARLDGFRYVLKSIGPGVYDAAQEINNSFGRCRHIGSYAYGWSETDKGAPARRKRATQGQIDRWPELAGARTEIAFIRANPASAYIEIDRAWPYLLWVREDVPQ